MGFNRQQLIARYLLLLAPKVRISETDPRTSRKRYIQVPIFVRYQRILDLEKQMPREKWDKHKEQLFGTSTEVFSVDSYDEIEIIKRLRVDFARWEGYDIDLQAKLIAQSQLATLVELVRRHDQIMSDNTKALAKKAADKQSQSSGGGSKKKRPATKTRFSK